MHNLCEARRFTIKYLTTVESKIILQQHSNDDIYKYALLEDYKGIPVNHDRFFNLACYSKKNNDFIAYISGYYPTPKNTLWIQTFIVSRKYLRQGYGTEFYKAIIQLLSIEIPIKKVYLACYKDNIQGRRFWESLEFQVTVKKEKLSENNLYVVYYIYEHTLKDYKPLPINNKEIFEYEQESFAYTRV